MTIVKLQDMKLIHRNPLHSYTLIMRKQKLRKQSHSPLQQKRIKYLEINLPKETKDLYIESYKTQMKEIKDDINKWKKYTMFLDWKNQYSANVYIIQSNL